MQTTNHDRPPDRPRSVAESSEHRRANKRPIGTHSHDMQIKRAYEPRTAQDGRRVLVDRLWPRGLSKHDLADAVWLRDVAPSAALRKWFGHKPERWTEFRRRYFAELRVNPTVKMLQEIIAAAPTTLIYSARDEIHNQAVALAEYLGEQARAAKKEK